MILVDTNVILDLFNDDDDWKQWSFDQIRSLSQTETLLINIIIYTELMPAYSTESMLNSFLRTSPLKKVHLPFSSAAPAARAFSEYRKRGGSKTATLPDFYIGAHAEADGLTILTRDPRRYRTYFPKVDLICPDSL